jgi:D-amino-acid dehydrogenase
VVVVGAGIVGLATALQLRRRGHEVLVLEREGIAAGASRGNAGAFAFSDIEPLASPGILRRLPRWLLDPLGPLALPPAYLPRIAPWLWRFWRASTPARVAASTGAQAALMQLASAATERLLDALQAQHLVQRGGNLHLYESEAEWRAGLPTWQLKSTHGVTFSHLHGARELAAVQPGLAPRFVCGTFVPGWMTIDDPHAWARRIGAAVVAAGGAIARAEVQALEPGAEGIGVRLRDGRVLQAARVVLAAGAWSHQLARTLGHRIPLETERGYNTTLPPGAFALARQLTFPGHGFVITPIGGGVRVGGAVELAGLEAPPNWARSDALLAKAQRFLPALNTEGGSRWMGCRPSLPDSLPVIGAAPGEPRVIYAFGHGHLGLTQSAATAELVAALLARAALPIDVRPFAAERFTSC